MAGSFVLGCVTGAPLINNSSPTTTNTTARKNPLLPPGLSPRAKLLFGVGFCGSFTTFSTYSVDVITWLQQGQTKKAVSYILTNNVGGVLAAAAGLVLVKTIFGSLDE